jgi:four helix bundle protein
MNERIYSHRDLIVYQKSFAAGRRIFELSKAFPREEMNSLTDQVRRSSRSVSANIAEAWRKRRYEKHFCSTLNVAEAEAAETQVWLEYASAHGYLDPQTAQQANAFYDEILRMIVAMINDPSRWCIQKKSGSGRDKESGSEGVRETEAEYSWDDDAPIIDQSDLLSPSPNSPSPNSPSPNSPSPNSPSPNSPSPNSPSLARDA